MPQDSDLGTEGSFGLENTHGNVCKDHINHADEHAISERMAGVFNNGDDICSVSGHIDEISARSMRELNREYCS